MRFAIVCKTCGWCRVTSAERGADLAKGEHLREEPKHEVTVSAIERTP